MNLTKATLTKMSIASIQFVDERSLVLAILLASEIVLYIMVGGLRDQRGPYPVAITLKKKSIDDLISTQICLNKILL